MGKLLLIFLFIIFLIVAFGISFLSRIFRLFKQQNGQRKNTEGYYNRNRQQQNKREHNSTEHKKVFGKEEGEYVDYVEIKKDQN